MTKKHFQAMAERFRALYASATETNDSGVLAGLLLAAYAFCDTAQDANPRFDRERFLEACGMHN